MVDLCGDGEWMKEEEARWVVERFKYVGDGCE